MPRQFTGRHSNYTGGESAISSPFMNPKYSLNLQNMHLGRNASVRQIPGYLATNPAVPITGITLKNGHHFVKADGTNVKLIAGGGKIYKKNGYQWDQVHTGLDSSAEVRFLTAGDLCIATNGVDAPLKSADGTTWAALGGTPPATTFKAVQHKGRVWFIERTNKMLASHTGLNTPETAEGYIDFKYVLKTGDELLDIATYVDLLVFYFRNHIVIYSGQTPSGVSADFAMVQRINDLGIVDTDLVMDLGTDQVFLTRAGFRSLRQIVTTGNLNMQSISQVEDPAITDAIRGNSSGNYAVAHYEKLSWYMALIHDTVWIYSYTFKAWARMVGADVNGMFMDKDGTVYLCGTEYVYEYGNGWSFNGKDMHLFWETGYIPLSPNAQKAYPDIAEIYVYGPEGSIMTFHHRFETHGPIGKAQTLNLKPKPSLMDEAVEGTWEEVFLMDATYPKPIRKSLNGEGESIQMMFSAVTKVGPIGIENISFSYALGGM